MRAGCRMDREAYNGLEGTSMKPSEVVVRRVPHKAGTVIPGEGGHPGYVVLSWWQTPLFCDEYYFRTGTKAQQVRYECIRCGVDPFGYGRELVWEEVPEPEISL